MPKKKSTSSTKKHQSFKLTPHNHPKERVLIYAIVALVIGLAIGWLLKDQYATVLGVSTF